MQAEEFRHAGQAQGATPERNAARTQHLHCHVVARGGQPHLLTRIVRREERVGGEKEGWKGRMSVAVCASCDMAGIAASWAFNQHELQAAHHLLVLDTDAALHKGRKQAGMLVS
jgi:hypothetical protein